jgi:putative N6-adenine-specific DNA methylase
VSGATIVQGAVDDDESETSHALIDGDEANDTPKVVANAAPASAHRAVQRIIVRFDHDRCTISADSSGELLHRRGWRQAVAKAPLRETLAAAMLAACEWDGAVPLVDPFCGSGTIGIEAALRARNIAPGLGRGFAMESWLGTDSAMVSGARAIARAAAKPGAGVAIVMSDRDEGAIAAARANAERAGVLNDLTIERRSLSETALATIGERGLLLTNPPYGLRVSDGADLRGLYTRLGDVLRAGGRGWRLAMLVPDRTLAASVRLPMDTLLRTSNGGIPVSVEATRPAR